MGDAPLYVQIARFLYIQHGCELCQEAQAELDAAELAYQAFYVTAGVNPTDAIIWNPDGTQEIVPRDRFEGFPILADMEIGLRFIGLPAIRQRAQLSIAPRPVPHP
jgi:hypothetical protein